MAAGNKHQNHNQQDHGEQPRQTDPKPGRYRHGCALGMLELRVAGKGRMALSPPTTSQRIGRGGDQVVVEQVRQSSPHDAAPLSLAAGFRSLSFSFACRRRPPWRVHCGRFRASLPSAGACAGFGSSASEASSRSAFLGQFRLALVRRRRSATCLPRMAAAINAEMREYSRPLSDSCSHAWSFSATFLGGLEALDRLLGGHPLDDLDQCRAARRGETCSIGSGSSVWCAISNSTSVDFGKGRRPVRRK